MHTIASKADQQRPASRPRPPDAFFVALSRAADHSVLWIAASVLLAAGGRRARSGAARGLAAIAVTSADGGPALKLRDAWRGAPATGTPALGGRRAGAMPAPAGKPRASGPGQRGRSYLHR